MALQAACSILMLRFCAEAMGIEQATKHHPRSVDLELVKQLIQKTKYSKLQQFLCKEFDAINSEHAGMLLP